MARTPMVTRTIISTKITVLALNTETCEPFNLTVELPGTFKSQADALKAVKASKETDLIAIAKVVSMGTKETLYGMSQEEFLQCAKELPPRAVKKTTEE